MLQTLQEHYYCDISIEAKKMEQKLPADETNISELLDSTATEVCTRGGVRHGLWLHAISTFLYYHFNWIFYNITVK